MSDTITLTNTMWEKLFTKYSILSNIDSDGYYQISARQIKEYREPRLMAKFDHESNLPKIFKENNLSILPISRGEYILSHFDSYMHFPNNYSEVYHLDFPDSIQSINPNIITSEAIAINCASISGIFSDFLDEDIIVPTVAGRMGSGEFTYQIYNTKSKSLVDIEVNNAQIEIDAAFEGTDTLTIVEAKRDISDDFIIRQLFYPFKSWNSRITKRIRLVYLVYSNGIFSLYEFVLRDNRCYNSLALIQQKRYTVEYMQISINEIEELARSIQIIDEPEFPFPQADSFERIVNLCELLETENLNRDKVTLLYDFTKRQTNYYTDAARYLGLINKTYSGREIHYHLTGKAKSILKLGFRERQLRLCACILEHRVFNLTFLECLKSGSLPEKNIVIELMKESHLYNVSEESTFKRRSSTILSWLNWIIKLCS